MAELHDADGPETKKLKMDEKLPEVEENKNSDMDSTESTQSNNQRTDAANALSESYDEKQNIGDASLVKEEKQNPPAAKAKTGEAKIKPEFIDHNHKRVIVTDYLPEKTKQELEKKGDKKLSGKNQSRPRRKIVPANERICPKAVAEEQCTYGKECKFSHDIEKYLAAKPKNVTGKECYVYETYGKCRFGVMCLFADKHLTDDFKNITDQEKYAKWENKTPVLNNISKDLQIRLRKREITLPNCETYFKEHKIQSKFKLLGGELEKLNKNVKFKMSGPVTDEDVIKTRPEERKLIDFSDKLYLAPLTTVGNLPFRRICKRLGADVTCGEMAMVTNLLQGQQSEWALLKRHESEDLFGVQVCGGHVDTMARCAEMLCRTCEIDFIDINCGCPIDLVFKKGEGSALMGRIGRFKEIATGMKSVMDVPLTVKMRTGIYENKLNADTVIPQIKECGVSLITLHGRTREQRYTQQADWAYIAKCASISKSDPNPVQFFGNGDILSYEDAYQNQLNTGVSGVMIARGALIKPWIFTEIKEKRHWDISSQERFDILKDFSNYGLDHWGSDQDGVEKTRRFLLEWLSFLYRYIPVGILERVPQKINERPPYFFGRNDLETIMASPNSNDWIKLSEMLLGPVPNDFTFLPKHKANAYK